MELLLTNWESVSDTHLTVATKREAVDLGGFGL